MLSFLVDFLGENTVFHVESKWLFLINPKPKDYNYKGSISFHAIRVFERIFSDEQQNCVKCFVAETSLFIETAIYSAILDKPAPWGKKFAMSGFFGNMSRLYMTGQDCCPN